ncbi:tetratricopeptide repeat protein [Novosphingobium sp. MMS21-SN21R]|uniref:tetratricopeptide repeat protein n=1 Tax=Novosphingobium sp. MMS21-SN21R TaxID=2969298 RepID=UPI0028867143|nr:tetratricopeptide repeat protein [Novosphingobium sp. MMS21-SN21R]MDT0507871.1 tetratricopeptide repeat protein [Novosphingobium sp. MMS21-SN21R]
MRYVLPLAPLALLLSACGEDSAARVARARAEIAAMELGAARVDLAAALVDIGDDAELLRLLADVQLRLGDGDGADATAARLERIGAKEPELARIRAEAALLRGHPDEALALLGADGSPTAWRIRAAARSALNDTDGALDALRRGAEAGADPLLLRDYARFLIDAQDYDGAARQAAALAQLQPVGFDALMLSADIAVRRGRMAEAHATLERAAKLFPRIPDPWIAHAIAYDIEGKLDEAIAMTARAAALAPDDARVTNLKVQFAGMKGDWEKVRSLLAKQEATLDPISANGLTYAEAMLRLGHPEQARALFQRALTRSPNNPYSRLMLAQAQLATGDGAAAYATVRPLSDSVLAGPRELELAEKAARAMGSPDADRLRLRLATARNSAAQGLTAKGQAALAREDWIAATDAYGQLAQLGDDADVLKRLAMALSHAGQAEQAMVAADRAKALRPDDPDTVYIAGYVRLAGGKDRMTGLALLRQACEAAPDNAMFRRSLARFSGPNGA